MKYIFIAYDYTLNSSGNEQYGIAEIFKNYLTKNNIDFYNHKFLLTANPLKLINKFSCMLSEINSKTEINYFIGYNPINAIFGVICRFVTRYKMKVIFISVDFSFTRFNNPILDKIYVYLDYLASILSDEVWSCSTKVYEYRKDLVSASKNFYIPNIPIIEKQNPSKFNVFTIVMIAEFSENYKFEEVIKLLDYLSKEQMNLIIIGAGDETIKNNLVSKYKNLIISKKLQITGYIPHKEVISILERSHLSLALYNGKKDFNFWGDSLKIRESTLLEIPVITTKNVNNYKEVLNENLGICLENYKDLTEAVNFLYKNPEIYKNMIQDIKKYNKNNNPDKFYSSRISS